ncbi:MAG: hypothetical protein CMK09_04890 [Ponticaulis sp.]|nr:hypothetical protein [Ponticaulis sp.]
MPSDLIELTSDQIGNALCLPDIERALDHSSALFFDLASADFSKKSRPGLPDRLHIFHRSNQVLMTPNERSRTN